jgi:hypothetical protein
MPMSETRTPSRVLGFQWGEEARSSPAMVAEARRGGGAMRLAGWLFNVGGGGGGTVLKLGFRFSGGGDGGEFRRHLRS